MGPDYDDLLDSLQRYFGAVVMHYTESDDPAVGRRGGMVWLGDNSVEIGSPMGEQSPVRGFVEKLGGMHSIALRITDVPGTRAWVESQGVPIVSTIGDEVFFTRPADTGGLLLEWSAMQTPDDPRYGYALPTPAEAPPTPIAPITQYGFVTGVVADPIATAEQLATLFGTDVVRATPAAAPGEIAAIVSLLDSLLVLFALPGDDAPWPWGPRPRKPRYHAHGLVVDDLDSALGALASAGIDVVGKLENAVLLDPAKLPAPTFLSDELMPEDPRSRAP
jgi:hypothetical protein